MADAEMGGLLAADPSPELRARIRQAAAEASPAPAWRFGWLWPVAAAAATLLVALAVWVGRTEAPVIPRDARSPHDGGEALSVVAGSDTRTGSAVPRAAATTAPTEARVAPRSAGPTGVRRAGGSLGTRPVGVPRDDSRVPRDDRAEPEVLVPPGGAEALVSFATLVHRDRLAPAAFLAAGEPPGDIPEPAALVIQPIEIVPLDPAGTSGT
jgi:hypothetical protein